MKRRAITRVLARAGLAALVLATLGTSSLAQRVTNPIYRPRPGRPDGSPLRGRFADTTDGVNGGARPGAFTVRSVDAGDHTLLLADDDGHTAEVFVEPRVFDLSTLQGGDEVEVDFIVPDGKDNSRLTAAAIWKLERVNP